MDNRASVRRKLDISVIMFPIALLGAGGGSRDLLDIFEACNQVQPTYDVLGYIVDPEFV